MLSPIRHPVLNIVSLILQGVTEHNRDHKTTEAPQSFAITSPAETILIAGHVWFPLSSVAIFTLFRTVVGVVLGSNMKTGIL